MATIDMTSGSAAFTAGVGLRDLYKLEMEVDFAAAVTTKGSALAANDVIQTLDLPADCFVLAAGVEVVTAMTGTSTDLALDLGITGGDVDNFMDGFDYDGASIGDVGAKAPATPLVYVSADDTLDILIQAQTGTFTGGKLKVWAYILPAMAYDAPGVAAAGS